MMINIFQRYSDSSSYVACCSYSEGDILLNHGCSVNDEIVTNVSNFLNNKFIEKETTQYSKGRLEIF